MKVKLQASRGNYESEGDGRKYSSDGGNIKVALNSCLARQNTATDKFKNQSFLLQKNSTPWLQSAFNTNPTGLDGIPILPRLFCIVKVKISNLDPILVYMSFR